jgi:hypothetical protein
MLVIRLQLRDDSCGGFYGMVRIFRKISKHQGRFHNGIILDHKIGVLPA